MIYDRYIINKCNYSFISYFLVLYMGENSVIIRLDNDLLPIFPYFTKPLLQTSDSKFKIPCTLYSRYKDNVR